MASFKRALYWILASAGIALAVVGLALFVRLSIHSGSFRILDLLGAPAALGILAFNFAVEKPLHFMLGLGAVIACVVAGWLALRHLAQTPWERRHATHFVIVGIAGALVGFGAAVAMVVSRLP